MDRFRDKANDALDQGQDQVDERTGGKYREQTERMADAARQRLGGGQTETTEGEEDTETSAEDTQDTEPLGMDEEDVDEHGRPLGERLQSWRDGGR